MKWRWIPKLNANGEWGRQYNQWWVLFYFRVWGIRGAFKYSCIVTATNNHSQMLLNRWTGRNIQTVYISCLSLCCLLTSRGSTEMTVYLFTLAYWCPYATLQLASVHGWQPQAIHMVVFCRYGLLLPRHLHQIKWEVGYNLVPYYLLTPCPSSTPTDSSLLCVLCYES